jgi:hypothetical protein
MDVTLNRAWQYVGRLEVCRVCLDRSEVRRCAATFVYSRSPTASRVSSQLPIDTSFETRPSVTVATWVTERNDTIKVPTRVRVPQFAHDLHILMRHPLLPQPHGFEGFVLLREHAEPHDLPVTQ